MYDELVKRLKDSALLLVFDQAHMLSARAVDFLTELWNATRSPQLWLGPEELYQKLERHEQWASRLDPTVPLSVTVDAEPNTNEVRGLVEHQIAPAGTQRRTRAAPQAMREAGRAREFPPRGDAPGDDALPARIAAQRRAQLVRPLCRQRAVPDEVQKRQLTTPITTN